MSERIPHESPQQSGRLVESSLELSNTLAALTDLIQHQNKVMQDMADASTRGTRDLLVVLRKIDDRQAAATAQSLQPIRTVAATSSSAWSPLLRSHLQNIQPNVDRWRGTLDTLLVFIALFSAVVTAFFIASLPALSEDTGKTTNELLKNLTEIIIIINGANASTLNITRAVPFTPDHSSIRLCVYWSLSLILSVSIASLAVTTRGYVSMISRSQHAQAHGKLTELHLRWEKTEKLLGPAVEVLPQLLIPPVILFVVGVLDTLMSISLPATIALSPILAAAIISCVFAVTVGAYTMYTVIHGCIYRSTSPFQSTLSSWLSSFTPSGKTRTRMVADPELRKEARSHAFHSTIQITHDDDVLDQAVAAVESVIEERQRSATNIGCSSNCIKVSSDEMATFRYLLSSEVSYRANLAVAASISKSLFVNSNASNSPKNPNVQIRTYTYMSSERIELLELLLTAPGNHSTDLWSSYFTMAMAQLLCCGTSTWWRTNGANPFEALSQAAPILSLLLTPFEDVGLNLPENRLWYTIESPVLYYAYEVLLSKLLESRPSLGLTDGIDRKTELHAIMGELMSSQSTRVLDSVHRILQMWSAPSRENHTPLLLRIRYYRHKPSIRVPLHGALAHWIINPRLSKLAPNEIMQLVLQAVTYSKDHWLANDRQQLTWIVFLCQELFSSIFQNCHADKMTLYPKLLKICVNLMLIALDTNGWYIHPAEEKLTFCSVSCEFRPLVIALLGEIIHNAPEMRLDLDTWRSLCSAFEQNPSEGRYRKSSDPAAWSTQEHREQVKQEIFDTFRRLAPTG
ncbi:hypothetical protein FPV67DRAFT_1170506 [Lyophyllum atratum]|nr:hypothetical protein FPV67DRAFT_1170506 [Lyophyllum atratum]